MPASLSDTPAGKLTAQEIAARVQRSQQPRVVVPTV